MGTKPGSSSDLPLPDPIGGQYGAGQNFSMRVAYTKYGEFEVDAAFSAFGKLLTFIIYYAHSISVKVMLFKTVDNFLLFFHNDL